MSAVDRLSASRRVHYGRFDCSHESKKNRTKREQQQNIDVQERNIALYKGKHDLALYIIHNVYVHVYYTCVMGVRVNRGC